MDLFRHPVILVVLFLLNFMGSYQRLWRTTDELENHISPDDLKEFIKMNNTTLPTTTEVDADYVAALEDISTRLPIPNMVDCYGPGSIMRQVFRLFNMKPDSSDDVNTHFFFSSRLYPLRVQVDHGPQFGLEWVDFKPNRKTVMIIHGFMSHSNASWVRDMTSAFLAWGDVNVIAVDWSGGGNTWKYWRAVANTRTVGSDVTGFFRRLMRETGAKVKDFHFVGHSLGAHIASYVSYHIGRVGRITGLDPAQPCFRTPDDTERLDATDADFVDIIHTNGRLMSRFGFGLPEPSGHADFYPNGGMQQPGCVNRSNSLISILNSLPFSPTKLQQAICNHGRAYLLFTESLINNNCSFRAYRWNLTYDGVNASIKAACKNEASCAEMGIKAIGAGKQHPANGPYLTLTNGKDPYCRTRSYAVAAQRETRDSLGRHMTVTELQRHQPARLFELLRDLRHGFKLDRSLTHIAPVANVTEAYADPMADDDDVKTTTAMSWYRRFIG